jgi:uroporphyrinogen III methyltransferase/synthase
MKALRLLKDCDAVVYDNLVPDEVVISLPPRIERHYVGKLADRHSLPQEEINKLLVDLSRKGKNVVRLKGGDPFVFGRGGEEARVLQGNNIPFEVVPGVTSGVAAPAYAGIPTTDRRRSSFVMFLTGHKAVEKAQSSVPWKWLGQARHGTLVIYMGVTEIERIVERLIKHGMAPDTPAAVIERGTFPTQRVVHTELKDLPERVTEENLRPPALFVIGDTVDLRYRLHWLEDKPLAGLRIMVTRPAHQAQPMYLQLRDLGAEVLPYPTIATEEDHHEDSWAALKDIEREKRWIVLTSENGVNFFFRQWFEHMGDTRHLARYRIAAVGTGTAEALAALHLTADFVPTKATTAELAKQMSEQLDLEDAIVIRVRGNLGDERVEDALTAAGARVTPFFVYRTYTPAWPEERKRKLFAHPPNVIVFTSGSTCDGLVENLTEEELTRLMKGAIVVSIGPSTSKVIQSHGIKVDLEAATHSIPGVVEELKQYRQHNKIERPL